GVPPQAGAAMSSLKDTVGRQKYSPTGGQVLSTVGDIVPVDQGPLEDLFFLSFDQLGSFTHTSTPTTYTAPTTPACVFTYPLAAGQIACAPDRGIATFERINNG